MAISLIEMKDYKILRKLIEEEEERENRKKKRKQTNRNKRKRRGLGLRIVEFTEVYTRASS